MRLPWWGLISKKNAFVFNHYLSSNCLYYQTKTFFFGFQKKIIKYLLSLKLCRKEISKINIIVKLRQENFFGVFVEGYFLLYIYKVLYICIYLNLTDLLFFCFISTQLHWLDLFWIFAKKKKTNIYFLLQKHK